MLLGSSLPWVSAPTMLRNIDYFSHLLVKLLVTTVELSLSLSLSRSQCSVRLVGS
jgi:hypothetical protein